MSKVTTIADATKCVAKMRAGKRCTADEMKATAMILSAALRTANAGRKQLQNQVKFLMNFVRQ
tara:strand:- start:157 stop:345 length:189 start_codon:yes stop_codon:yes gene_type:complete